MNRLYLLVWLGIDKFSCISQTAASVKHSRSSSTSSKEQGFVVGARLAATLRGAYQGRHRSWPDSAVTPLRMMASDAAFLDKVTAAGSASALASLVVAPLEVVKVGTARSLT